MGLRPPHQSSFFRLQFIYFCMFLVPRPRFIWFCFLLVIIPLGRFLKVQCTSERLIYIDPFLFVFFRCPIQLFINQRKLSQNLCGCGRRLFYAFFLGSQFSTNRLNIIVITTIFYIECVHLRVTI